MQTPEQSWQDYRRRTMPIDAGPVQLAETKRAFMAGMMALDGIIIDIASLPDGDAENALTATRRQLLTIAAEYVVEGARGPAN